MIRTKIPVDWNKKKRKSGIVYLDTVNRIEPAGVNRNRITFEIVNYVLDTITERVTVENEQGNLVFKDKTTVYLRPIDKDQPSYRSDTFYTLFPSLLPEDYDQAMIDQIAYNNSLENNDENYYWDLTANDLEIVTQSMLQSILTVTFTDI